MKLNAMLFATGICLALGACASTTEDTRPTIVHGDDQIRIDTGGVPPDKQGEVQLVLQQRDASARRCYQDVLNEKKTRDFKGTVTIMLSLNTNGTAKGVRVMSSTLSNKEVEDCLCSTIKEFEFPKLDRGGDIQYVYKFEPQY